MTKTREDKVKEFHKAMGLDVDSQARVSLLILRENLIQEEANEVSEELDRISMLITHGNKVEKKDWAALLKELADLQYVLSGTIVALSDLKNFEEAFNRVHSSNMSKLDEEGKPVYDSRGKVMKGPYYKKPYLTDLL